MTYVSRVSAEGVFIIGQFQNLVSLSIMVLLVQDATCKRQFGFIQNHYNQEHLSVEEDSFGREHGGRPPDPGNAMDVRLKRHNPEHLLVEEDSFGREHLLVERQSSTGFSTIEEVAVVPSSDEAEILPGLVESYKEKNLEAVLSDGEIFLNPVEQADPLPGSVLGAGYASSLPLDSSGWLANDKRLKHTEALSNSALWALSTPETSLVAHQNVSQALDHQVVHDIGDTASSSKKRSSESDGNANGVITFESLGEKLHIVHPNKIEVGPTDETVDIEGSLGDSKQHRRAQWLFVLLLSLTLFIVGMTTYWNLPWIPEFLERYGSGADNDFTPREKCSAYDGLPCMALQQQLSKNWDVGKEIKAQREQPTANHENSKVRDKDGQKQQAL